MFNNNQSLFYIDSRIVKLYKRLVNAAKTGNFNQLPEAIRSVFINELETVRSYVDALIKQPGFMGGIRPRLTGEIPDDIETKILAREFGKLSDTDPIPAEIQEIIDKNTLRNIDYDKFLFMLGDNYAALRTLVRLRKDISDVFIQPIEYINEYHRSFGFDIYDVFPPGVRRQLLANELSILKKKGTTLSFGQLLHALGYSDFAITGYWLDQDVSDSLFKFFPRVMFTQGNPLVDYLDPLIVKVDDNEDPLWMLTNSDLVSLKSTDEVWFPSRAPYIGLILSLNLEDMTTTNSLLFGAIFFATTVFRNEMKSVRNIGIDEFGQDVSISELYLAISWLTKEHFGWTPFVSDKHKEMYVWNGDYTDNNGNILDDDTLTQLILQDWKSIFIEPIDTFLEKERRQLLFREKFIKINATQSGKIELNDEYPLEYVNFVDANSKYRIYPDEYLYSSGNLEVFVNSSYAGHTLYITALDYDIANKYESGEYYITYSLPYERIITHNLGNKYNIVVQFIRDYSNGSWHVAIPDEIHFINESQLKVINNGPSVLNKMVQVKVYKPDSIAEITPSITQLEFLIEHDLGFQYPIVEVVDKTIDSYILPDTIEYVNDNSFKISFSSTVINHDLVVLIKTGNSYTLEPVSYDGHYTHLIVDGIDKTVESELQERNPEFYNFVRSKIVAGASSAENLLKYLVQQLEVYLYDVSGIYFPFRKFLFGFDEDVKRVFNWSKPYHVKLLRVLTSALIKDPVNDAMLVGDHFLALKPLVRLWDYYGCVYDNGGIYTQSGWKYDLCRRVSDFYRIQITKRIHDGFAGLRYDIGKHFDSGYTFDMSPAIGDSVFYYKITNIIQENINIDHAHKTLIDVKLENQPYSLNSSYVKNNVILNTLDIVNKLEYHINNITFQTNDYYGSISENNGFIIFIQPSADSHQVVEQALNKLVQLRFSNTINVDDSNLNITVS